MIQACMCNKLNETAQRLTAQSLQLGYYIHLVMQKSPHMRYSVSLQYVTSQQHQEYKVNVLTPIRHVAYSILTAIKYQWRLRSNREPHSNFGRP